jgi:hypothetical protein
MHGSCCVAATFSPVLPKVNLLWGGVLRKIFEPKNDEATGDWRKLHNEELHDL